jgi:hypothetical protein
MNMDDFQARARAAAASFSSMNPAEPLAQTLMNDKPTIDSAIKAYMSITAARSWSASDPNMQARNGLLCARSLSKKINSYRIPIASDSEEKDDSKVMEFGVVRILWNGLIDKDKKPSMVLGRQTLCHIFPSILEELKENIPDGVSPELFLAFIEDFGRLLDDAKKRIESPALNEEKKKRVDIQDDDSCLLWDVDGGKAELKRRRDRRGNAEHERLTIEEIPEDEN